MQDFLKREKIKYKFSKKFLNLADTICKKILSRKDELNETQKVVLALTIAMIVNEGFYALMEDLASKDDINLAFRLVRFPAGPFEFAEQIGLRNILNFLNLAQVELMSGRYKPALLLARKSE